MNKTPKSKAETVEQRVLRHAINTRDAVRDLAVMKSTYEYELHKMADRLDIIAKQIGLEALTLKA